MKRSNKNGRRFWTSAEHAAVAAALGALAIGCASPTGVARVEQVRRQYQAAVADERIPKHASVPLYEARGAVERLEKASKEGVDEEEVDHLAYLAEKRIEISRKAADTGIARAEVERLGKTRDELRIQNAQQQADEAGLQALEAREDAVNAHMAARDAEQAAAAAEGQLDAAQDRARSLANEIDELTTKTDDRGLVLMLDSVLFATGSATLKPGAERVLGRVADLLNEYPDRSVVVEGHTDSQGSESYNLMLSRSRAEAVADTLRMNGVAANRVETRGLGEGAPVAPNENAAGRQQNRRVEIILRTPAGGAPARRGSM
jgi:outer membrane protein OmpA-like peptidoglycan-associated protein